MRPTFSLDAPEVQTAGKQAPRAPPGVSVIEIVRQRTLAAPVTRVWDLIEPVERLPQWFAGTETAVPLDGRGLGRTQRVGGRWGNHRYEIDETVIAYEPPRVLAWRHDAERLDDKAAPKISRHTEFWIELERLDRRTQVELTSRQVPDSLLKAILIRLFAAPRIARMLGSSLEKMTAILDRSIGGD